LKNASTTLQSFTYADSPAETILSETDTPSSPQSPASYAYDAQGRITSDTPDSNSAAAMGAATYDGDGLRAATTITPAGHSATTQQ
jgi:YD repeat-containing protein